MSKIEAGCLARIKNSAHLYLNGLFCQVLEWVPKGEMKSVDGENHFATRDVWLIRLATQVTPWAAYPASTVRYALADSSQLTPFDNPGDDEADLLLAPLPTTPEKVPA